MALNEKKWWSTHVKPRWHRPDKSRLANKVQDAFNAGLPDVDACFNGVVAKIELKYAVAWPKYETTLLTFSKNKNDNSYCVASPGQVVQLRLWNQCGGHAFLLIGVGKEWFLVNIKLLTDELNHGVTRSTLFAIADLTGDSYDSLKKIPDYLENTYGHG